MIRLSKVSKQFPTGVFALENISFEVGKGEFVLLVGPTGSGKTTIFRLLTRESLPTGGEIVVDNWDIVKLPGNKISHLRKKIGVVFQDLKLLMDRTIFENIILPLEVSGINPVSAKKIAEEIMEKVGIESHKDKFPIQLSGGELQRAAIARALTLEPDILLADEPTGNLDQETAMEIVKLLLEINKKGTTIIMATHNEDIMKALSKRVIFLNKGKLAKDSAPMHSPPKSDNIEKGNKKAESKPKPEKKNPSAGSGLKEDEDF
ncbi:MAG: ATP-binding cassette domain-containing protein [Candidatus Levybacteria bacterium]|nr:ATP-binding cassette domain-containing protein [Candidatus Levybacteria bacterium]